MADAGFDRLIGDALAFFGELDADNTRDWFQGQKARYQAEVLGPAKALSDVLGAEIEAMAGAPVTPKIFRINRDVRFSKDKTPYNTHLHMLWSGSGDGAWFLGLSPGYFRAGFGVMDLKGDRLAAFREGIAGPKGASLVDVVERLTGEDVDFGEPELKRVPAPFEKDDARGQYLRRKSLAGWVDLDAGSAALPADVATAFGHLDAVRDPLSAVLGG